MTFALSPQKVILLAVQLAADSDIDSLASLTFQHPKVLHKDLVLRILLTYLPETTSSSEYVSFLQELASDELVARQPADVPVCDLGDISNDEAARRARRLHLLHLTTPEAGIDGEDDSITLFLFRRAHRVDEEAGMLTQLPALLTPFLSHAPGIRTWLLSSLLPLLRRNYEYYPNDGIPFTLAEFQKLPDAVAVAALLSRTGSNANLESVGRDIRGLVGPWLHNDARWSPVATMDESFRYAVTVDSAPNDVICPGWERVLDWLVAQASQSWNVAVAVVEHWNGPEDVDLGDADSWLREEQQRYLERRYARAVLACAYLITETSVEAFEAAHQMIVKVTDLLGDEDLPSLQQGIDTLPSVPSLDTNFVANSKNTAWMRDDLLNERNPLTSPSSQATHLLHGLMVSACLLSQRGIPYTVKKAGDLLFIQDEREQKSQASQLILELTSKISNKDDDAWVKARREILWLRSWGLHPNDSRNACGVFGRLSKDFLEAEILKALLSNGHLSLARALYEDGDVQLPPSLLQTTIITAALSAYDNASNPNRARGGLKKCDEIINAFPRTVDPSTPSRQRIEALLKATHALAEYRLVLKQGEPFSPVILRVHSDPIGIIGKVLEQNPKCYTRIQDLQEVGSNMVKSGLTLRDCTCSFHACLPARGEAEHLNMAETRITALCIEAALREDDFETAYSFIVNRLGAAQQSAEDDQHRKVRGDWAWRAALQAGQYIRNDRSTRPTHLGTASGNPEIRHLEQRIDCLSTALRIAPPSQLQEILKTYRRCDEQLDSALKVEAALDAAADEGVHMPGSFGAAPSVPARHRLAVSSGPILAKKTQVDDSPMSLFDLSRATARAASRNFSALSSLHASTGAKAVSQSPVPAREMAQATAGDSDDWGDWGDADNSQDSQRMRKRDQLRDAAMGTLTSGVGWLIGAQPQPQDTKRHDAERERQGGW